MRFCFFFFSSSFLRRCRAWFSVIQFVYGSRGFDVINRAGVFCCGGILLAQNKKPNLLRRTYAHAQRMNDTDIFTIKCNTKFSNYMEICASDWVSSRKKKLIHWTVFLFFSIASECHHKIVFGICAQAQTQIQPLISFIKMVVFFFSSFVLLQSLCVCVCVSLPPTHGLWMVVTTVVRCHLFVLSWFREMSMRQATTNPHWQNNNNQKTFLMNKRCCEYNWLAKQTFILYCKAEEWKKKLWHKMQSNELG